MKNKIITICVILLFSLTFASARHPDLHCEGGCGGGIGVTPVEEEPKPHFIDTSKSKWNLDKKNMFVMFMFKNQIKPLKCDKHYYYMRFDGQGIEILEPSKLPPYEQIEYSMDGSLELCDGINFEYTKLWFGNKAIILKMEKDNK